MRILASCPLLAFGAEDAADKINLIAVSRYKTYPARLNLQPSASLSEIMYNINAETIRRLQGICSQVYNYINNRAGHGAAQRPGRIIQAGTYDCPMNAASAREIWGRHEYTSLEFYED